MTVRITAEDVQILRMEIAYLEAALLDTRNELVKERELNVQLSCELNALMWRALAAESAHAYGCTRLHLTESETPPTDVSVIGYWFDSEGDFCHEEFQIDKDGVWWVTDGVFGAFIRDEWGVSRSRARPVAWQHYSSDSEVIAFLKERGAWPEK